MRGPSSASRALLLALMLAGCARNTSTASTGEPIDTGKACARASDCQSGDCLLLANGESVCTTACSSTSQCVAGWKCEGLPLQSGHLCACDPSPEVCDGLDNDCNGLVDDGAAPDEQCSQKTAGFSCVNGACGCALMCGGRCVSPDWDSANCGACGQICPGETGCVDGVCGCGPGKTPCGDLCANLLGSPPNCGACGHACPTGDICSNSECVCPIDEVDCDGVCSNLTFDSGNCGGCGNKCEPDLFCADGQCTCRPPLASCAGTCVDLSIDALNCGACGQACASVAGTSATCLAGRCTGTVASADEPVLALVTDATSLYWIENSGPQMPTPRAFIKSVPLQGGDVSTLASGGLNPVALAVDPTFLYWLAGNTVIQDPYTQADVWVSGSGALLKIPITGGDAITVATGLNNPLQVVASGPVLCWSSSGAGSDIGAIQAMNLGGDGSESDTPASLSTGALAADNLNVYWGASNATIMGLALGGSVPRTLVQAASVPTALVVQNGLLYWADSAGAIQTVPVTGGSSTALASSALPAESLAVDELKLYWIAGGASVVEAHLDGSAMETLASGSQYAGLAIDDSGLYYFDQLVGAIMRVSPK